jgi:hypothetical protein
VNGSNDFAEALSMEHTVLELKVIEDVYGEENLVWGHTQGQVTERLPLLHCEGEVKYWLSTNAR